MIQGFLACRKHSERIVLLVKMMAKSGLPCFKAGAERTVKGLEKRLALNLTEVQVRGASARGGGGGQGTQGAEHTVKGLEKRLALNLTEVQVREEAARWGGTGSAGED